MTAASRWYEAQRVGLGEEFMAAIDTALRLIESNPAVGSRPPAYTSEPTSEMPEMALVADIKGVWSRAGTRVIT